MITMEVPSVSSGHTSLYFDDTGLEKRAELAERIQQLLKSGHAIFLVDGSDARMVKGYDPDTNEFVILSSRKLIPTRAKTVDESGTTVPYRPRAKASGQKITAVAPHQGG